MTTESKPRCSKNLPTQGWRPGRPCSRNGTIKRDGRWYCHQHDPVVVAERRLAAGKKWRRENDRKVAERTYKKARGEAYYKILKLTAALSTGGGRPPVEHLQFFAADVLKAIAHAEQFHPDSEHWK